MFVVTLLVIALTGFLLEGVRIAMDRSRLRRHPVRRLDRRPGADRASASDAGRAAPRAVVVPRAARDHVRGEHPVHQGRAHADELRLACRCATRWPASGCAPIPPERAAEPAGYGDAGRLQPAAPAPARRVHEVRPLPRGVPGQRHRPPAVPARRDPRAARAVQRRDARRPGSAACSVAARRARPTATGFTPA